MRFPLCPENIIIIRIINISSRRSSSNSNISVSGATLSTTYAAGLQIYGLCSSLDVGCLCSLLCVFLSSCALTASTVCLDHVSQSSQLDAFHVAVHGVSVS